MQCREEPEFYRARMKAARRLLRGEPRPFDLPSQAEIREQVHELSHRMHRDRLSDEPPGGDLASSRSAETDVDERGEHEVNAQGADAHQASTERFLAFRLMLLPLEDVEQSPRWHPEGDALYHSLQVFALAREEQPYDEEFLLAALLHDVGKAVDRRDHTTASLAVLEGLISERTHWLIEHLPDALTLREGKLGVRSRRRLEASEDFEDLLLLAECDRAGRQRGVEVPDVEEALGYLIALAEHCEG